MFHDKSAPEGKHCSVRFRNLTGCLSSPWYVKELQGQIVHHRRPRLSAPVAFTNKRHQYIFWDLKGVSCKGRGIIITVDILDIRDRGMHVY